MTPNQLRCQFENLKRRYARVIAAAWLLPPADQITELWNIAVAKKQPKPNSVSCVRMVADAGFRLKTWNALHGYMTVCRRYGGSPDFLEIIQKLLPPKKPVFLSQVLPGIF